MKRFALGSLLVASLVACSSAVERNTDTSDPLGQNQNAQPNLNQGDSGTGVIGNAPIGTVSGRVFAPNGRLPIPGALVYVTSTKPDAIPQKTYCDKCVDTGGGQSAVLSKIDGRFELKVYSAGTYYLVTQKGQFRRVRRMEISKGSVTVADEDTTFPSRTSGDDTAPLMAVVAADSDGYDRIERGLEKLGITQYDIINTSNAETFVKSAARMQKYHVVFLPCGAGGVGGPGACGADRTADTGTKSALRDFVSSGGKLYVTDFSYEYVNQAWPGYTKWTEQKQGVIVSPIPGIELPGPDWSKDGRGKACTSEPWSGEAKFEDPSIGNWLKQADVAGSGNLTLDGNWTTLAGVNEVTGKDENGAPLKMTPKIWARGKKGNEFIPTTISFQDTCGRVLFSSYHTENDNASGGGGATELTAQEASLIYVLLEVNACVGEQPIVR